MIAVTLSTAHWTADDAGPLLDLSVGDLLRSAAERAPDRPALVAGDMESAQRLRMTYAELRDVSERAARALLRIAVSGWLSSCASDAVISPSIVSRETRASSRRLLAASS